MPSEKRSFTLGQIAGFICFLALGVAAVIAFVAYLLPLVINVDPDSALYKVIGVFETILPIVSLVGLVFGAFSFAANHGLVVRILLGVFIVVFIAAIIMLILGYYGIV